MTLEAKLSERIGVVVVLALGGMLGCSDDAPGAGGAAMYMALGAEEPTQVFEVGLDSESFDSALSELGFTPDGLSDLGPRIAGAPRVRFEIAPNAETTFFDVAIANMAGDEPAPTDSGILLGGGGNQATLLLPAIQKYTASGAEVSKTGPAVLFFEVEGDRLVVNESSVELPEPQSAAPDSFFDIAVDFDAMPTATATERTMVESARGPYPVVRARFGSTAEDGRSSTEEIVFSYDKPEVKTLIDANVLVSTYVDVRDPAGLTRFRFRSLRNRLQEGEPNEASAREGTTQAITFTGLEFASTDSTEQKTLFQSDYTSYDSSTLDLAARDLGDLVSALDISAKDALLRWHGGVDDVGASVPETKTATTARFVDMVVDVGIHESLFCTMATPDLIKAGKDPAISGGLDRDLIRRTQGRIVEAAFLAPKPSRLTVRFQDLLVSSLGTMPQSEGDTSSQCEAVRALGEALGELTLTSLSTGEAQEIEGARDNLQLGGLALVDQQVADFIDHMNSASPTDADIEGAWLSTAKEEAAVLVSTLESEATRGPALQASARILLGL